MILLYFAIISIAFVSPLCSFLLFAPKDSSKFIAYISIFERFLKDTFPSQFNVFILLVQLGMSISLHLLLAKFRSYLDL